MQRWSGRRDSNPIYAGGASAPVWIDHRRPTRGRRKLPVFPGCQKWICQGSSLPPCLGQRQQLPATRQLRSRRVSAGCRPAIVRQERD